jgi:hypothetical protein
MQQVSNGPMLPICCQLFANWLTLTARACYDNVMSKSHCENCGRENPYTHHEDSYTECCNELVCQGEGRNRFGVEGNFRTACCWAKATLLFGGSENVPEGSSQLR